MPLHKLLLYPFSIVYDAVTRFRNHLYNIGYKPVIHFERVVVSVGNLSVGGTGKTPMVEYLIRLLKDRYQLATLSRGYGRKTKGFVVATAEERATGIGDEPMQFFKKFGDEVMVTVGEERAIAIPEIIFRKEEVEVILLDDAYQHRKVDRDLNILLTAYDAPFFKDYILPAGRLRESRKGAKRADVVVVTKCPEDFSEEEEKYYEKQVLQYTVPGTPVFFSAIKYETPEPVYEKVDHTTGKVILVSGLANARYFEDFIKKTYTVAQHKAFGDHHHYTLKDVLAIKGAYEELKGEEGFILTTEKDMVKFLRSDFKEVLKTLPFYYVPIKTHILNKEKAFQELILNSIGKRKESLKGII